MSLRLKSELRLRLGPQHCEAALWQRGLRKRCIASFTQCGSGTSQLDQAIDGLVAAGHQLPDAAAISIDDELLYFATMPAAGNWQETRASAAAYFADSLGLEGLLVVVCLAPGGRSWLSVALDAGLVDGWRAALDQRGIALRHLRVGLFEDLLRLRASESLRDGSLVLLRGEGATFVSMAAGAITEIAWERCEVKDPEALLARVRAHCERRSPPEVDGLARRPVFVLPFDLEQQESLAPIAAQQAWRLLALAQVGQPA